MKSFLSLFYTRPAKTIYLIIIMILAYFVGEYQVNYFKYFSEDKASFINALAQIDSFEYEKSYYFHNTVTDTAEAMVELAMEYPDTFSGKKSKDELMIYYDSIGDKSFAKNLEVLGRVDGLEFAVVNHTKAKVYSNIKEINGLRSGEDIRKYFGESGKNLLIARSCKNPYFATSTYIDFAEDIRDCAEQYADNFDLYIRFGSSEQFDATAQQCRELHFEMRKKIEKLNDTVAICIGCIVAITLLQLIVTGKQEPGGKTYLSLTNKIPVDLFTAINILVLYCIMALYRTSATVVINHGMELETLWFMRSEEFYISRTKYCAMIFICILINYLCVVKRAYKTGTILTNTYMYPAIKRFIKKTKKDKVKEDTEAGTENP